MPAGPPVSAVPSPVTAICWWRPCWRSTPSASRGRPAFPWPSPASRSARPSSRSRRWKGSRESRRWRGVDAAQAVGAGEPDALQATTIGIIVTNARVDKVGCLRLAQSGHDGLARALDPVHTGGDGDALVAAATGEVEAPLETVRALAAWVVEQAVLNAVPAAPVGDSDGHDPG